MFPSTFSVFNRPTVNDRLNSPAHSTLHNSVSSAVGQLEAVIGRDGDSSIAGTLIYQIRSADSNGGGHVQTANKGGTGQTAFTKGDILVATSSSVLAKLAVTGIDGQALVADSATAAGVKWGVPNSNPTVRTYATPSTLTWSKPSNLAYIIVDNWGGGGGGEKRGTNPPQPGAGGSGGYSRKVIAASLLGLTETIVVAAGGVIASVGGRSSFGTTSFMSANGGNPGNNGAGGTGGAAVGDITIQGFTGGTWTNIGGGIGGRGADAPLGVGQGGASSVLGGAGVNAQRHAAGGGGGNGTDDGGTGAPGLVVVYEY